MKNDIYKLVNCPFCGSPLNNKVKITDKDDYCFSCSSCGEFMMTKELFDDFIEHKVFEVFSFFARIVKNKKSKLYLSEKPLNAPDGYENVFIPPFLLSK